MFAMSVLAVKVGRLRILFCQIFAGLLVWLSQSLIGLDGPPETWSERRLCQLPIDALLGGFC